MIQNSVEMEGHTPGQPRPDDRSQGESGQCGTVGESVSKIISPPPHFLYTVGCLGLFPPVFMSSMETPP